MKKNLRLFVFILGLAAALSAAAALKRLGVALLPAPGAANALAASGGAYNLDWSAFPSSGGGSLSGGAFQAEITFGQPVAGRSLGGPFSLQAGFVPGLLPPWGVYLPRVQR